MIEVVAGGIVLWTAVSKALGNGSAMREAIKKSEQSQKSAIESRDFIEKIRHSLEVPTVKDTDENKV
jgi:hypothetical protein